jgi:hypothetical protein
MIYISLGSICFPRYYIKNTLNLSKKNGYKSCPFDLCITPLKSLIECIETDFSSFFEDLHLIPWSPVAGREQKNEVNAIKNKYKMIFNHEGSSHSHLFYEKNDDSYYYRNDFENFKSRYMTRIQNFNNYILSNKDITFLIQLMPEDDTIENFKKIEQVLKKKYIQKNIKILKL